MTSSTLCWEPSAVNQNAEPETRVLILGAGNLLLRDEGVGVHVAQRLGWMSLPEGVQAVDCGTALLDAVSLIKKAERLIVVDAIRTGTRPGTLFRLRDKDIAELPRKRVSLHQLGLLEALDMVDKLGKKPPTIIIGVEPEDTAPGMELSATLQRVLPRILDVVLAEAGTSETTNTGSGGGQR